MTGIEVPDSSWFFVELSSVRYALVELLSAPAGSRPEKAPAYGSLNCRGHVQGLYLELGFLLLRRSRCPAYNTPSELTLKPFVHLSALVSLWLNPSCLLLVLPRPAGSIPLRRSILFIKCADAQNPRAPEEPPLRSIQKSEQVTNSFSGIE